MGLGGGEEMSGGNSDEGDREGGEGKVEEGDS